ncbi:MAG: hypothetical protein QOH03_987 [Kribbellaceae bacterium]|jgi:hypothetical protein|nr:hypothetical protein [Kribbellaceae bacterium]
MKRKEVSAVPLRWQLSVSQALMSRCAITLTQFDHTFDWFRPDLPETMNDAAQLGAA